MSIYVDLCRFMSIYVDLCRFHCNVPTILEACQIGAHSSKCFHSQGLETFENLWQHGKPVGSWSNASSRALPVAKILTNCRESIHCQKHPQCLAWTCGSLNLKAPCNPTLARRVNTSGFSSAEGMAHRRMCRITLRTNTHQQCCKVLTPIPGWTTTFQTAPISFSFAAAWLCWRSERG